ncbi:MAG: magnesium transporter CorA [Burkholderiales bacterium]|nr:magnesium transporter CorA [Burkholderiales bacterium]
MLTAFTVSARGPDRRAVRDREDLTEDVLWLDMLNPSELERQWVLDAYGHRANFVDELIEIEASARYFHDAGGDHLRLYFLQADERSARNIDVGFTLDGKRLYSLHAADVSALKTFHTQTEGLSRPPTDPISILLGIDALRVAVLADTFERMHGELESLSGAIFSGGERVMEALLQRLGRIEDANGKARLGMIENRRALSAFGANGKHHLEADMLSEHLRDVDSLMSHSQYLFEKVDFLMDSALGMIDIQHSRRLSIFTVLSVVLMPPTLIASIYGMNFRHMPELDWLLGYPMALALMLAVAVGPIVYLRHKKWL